MFLNIFPRISNFHFLADHCFSHFDFPDVKRLSKQSLKTEQSSFGYFLGGKVYRGLKLCQTSPFIVVLRSPIGLGGIAKRKQFQETCVKFSLDVLTDEPLAVIYASDRISEDTVALGPVRTLTARESTVTAGPKT